MSRKFLRERWRTEPELGRIVSDLHGLFRRGRGLFRRDRDIRGAIPSIGLVGGLGDLRGFPAEQSLISRCTFENLDLSYSSFAGCWIERSKFVNCKFQDVDFTSFSDHGNNFENCVFSGCKFNGGAIGYDGTRFVNCGFEKCRFTRTIFCRTEFVSVLFENCTLKGIDFGASSFEDCTFVGELNDIWFRGGFATQIENMQIKEFGVPKKNEMKDVSFENADLHDLTFSDNCDLSTAKITKSENCIKFSDWKVRLEFLKSQLPNWPEAERKEAEIFANSYLVHAMHQSWHIINREDIERDYGKEIAPKILELLKNADVKR